MQITTQWLSLILAILVVTFLHFFFAYGLQCFYCHFNTYLSTVNPVWTGKESQQHSVHTNSVALCEMAKCNFEWYSVHINSVELHEMAQHNVEWYSVHTNGVVSCEMAQRNVKWCSVAWNGCCCQYLLSTLAVENRQTEEFLDHSANFRKIKITL